MFYLCKNKCSNKEFTTIQLYYQNSIVFKKPSYTDYRALEVFVKEKFLPNYHLKTYLFAHESLCLISAGMQFRQSRTYVIPNVNHGQENEMLDITTQIRYATFG